jgi:hypothetical protein
MRHRGFRLTPILIVAAACGGPEFSATPADLDASSDRNETVDPPVADGLLLWLRADLGVTTSNSAVSEWADQSGNHLDARQVDPSRQPTWTATGVAGRPTVVFNAEDFLSLPSGFADFSRGVSLFAVAVVTEAATCVDIIHLSNGPEFDDIALGRHNAREVYEVLEGVLTGADFSLGRAHVLSVVHDTDLSVSMRIDGGGRTGGTFDLPRTAMRTSNVIGRSLYADCGSVHGGVTEVLLYRRALDDAERVRVETQLQNRWACCR